jgi:hypothetical protein
VDKRMYIVEIFKYHREEVYGNGKDYPQTGNTIAFP